MTSTTTPSTTSPAATSPAPKPGLASDYPVIAAHLIAAVFAYVLTLLITRGIIPGVQASPLTQAILPPVTALLLALLGYLVTYFVSPAAKFAARVNAEVERRLGVNVLPALVGAAETVVDPLLQKFDGLLTPGPHLTSEALAAATAKVYGGITAAPMPAPADATAVIPPVGSVIPPAAVASAADAAFAAAAATQAAAQAATGS
jgi:hypothetical protein